MSLSLATPKTSGLGINHSHSNSWSLPHNGFSPCICSLPSHSAFRTAHTTHDGHFRCIVPGCFHGRIPIPSPAPLHEELLQAHIQAQAAKAQFAYQQYYATDILPHTTPLPSTPPPSPLPTSPSTLPDLGDYQLPLKKKKKNKNKKKNHISPPPSPTISLTPPTSPTPTPTTPTKNTNHAALLASKRLQKRNLLLDSQKRLFEIHTSPWFKDFQNELSSFDFSSLKPAGTYQSPATIAFKAERKRLKKLRRKNSTPTPTPPTPNPPTTTPTPTPTPTHTPTITTSSPPTPPTTHTFTSAWNTPNTSTTTPELPFISHTSNSHTKKLHRRLKGAQRGFHLSQTIFTHAEAKDVQANRIAQLHASKH